MAFSTSLSKEQALQKARQYCAYQERCHQETKEKLYSYGLRTTDVDLVLSQLIEEDYLNEERFALQYAGGKFRQKKWGRNKIKYALKQKQVSEYCIKKALASIDDEACLQTMEKLIADKLPLLKTSKTKFELQQKLYAYLLQKGYESYLINDAIQAAER